MRVIITAATVAEWMPSFLEMNNLYTSDSQRFKVQFHQSGIGMLATAVSLTKLVYEEKPDLIVDMATLTGAARVALGPDLPPFYTDDAKLAASARVFHGVTGS